MNQGTYNAAVRGNNMSPDTPTTPGGSSLYKPNVNRTKTKKWVEAKVQSYDGDDWGNEYDDDEEEEEDEPPMPPPPASRTTGLRQAGQSRTFSQPVNSPEPIPLAVSGRTPSGPAALRAQTESPGTAGLPSQKLHQSTASTSTPPPGPTLGAPPPIQQDSIPAETARPTGAGQELRGLSASPKLPEMSRMSGFGDDFFSPPPKPSYDDPAASGKSPAGPESQSPPSMLDGPKLEPNPDIKLPSPEAANAEPQKSSPPDQPVYDQRPQLPGTWVTETTKPGAADAASPAPPASSLANTEAPAESKTQAEFDDLDPTTKVKRLSVDPGAGSMAAPDPSDGGFGESVGEHDQEVANRNLAAGPGFHPTRQSLPPLDTGESRPPANPAPETEPEPIPSSASQPNTASTSSAFSPTAPLNPNRPDLTQPGSTLPGAGPRKNTTSTIGTASPVKESDKLREEIMRSLSPNAEPGPESGATLAPSNTHGSSQDQELRESRYLSDFYDDYMATPTEDKSLRDTFKKGDPGVQNVAPLSPGKSSEPASEPRQRRFSWEAEGPEQVNVNPTEDPAHRTLSPDSALGASQTLEKPESEGRTATHQVSDVSMRPEGAQGLAVLDPPSPMSEPADKAPQFGQEEKVLVEPGTAPIILDEKEQMSSSIPGVTFPSGDAEALQASIMGFRDILGISSTERRIEKMEETREQFLTMDWGLSGWMLQMKELHDQDGGQGPQDTGDAPGQKPGPASVSQPAAQQPYYQQYLNASNPNVSLGRTASGSIAPSGTSGFQSGAQVGVKSKELLQAAGAFGNKGMKSGMKLFNKGKSKLRERGDKVKFP